MVAFTQLKTAYENRYDGVRTAKRSGQKVIGYVGAAFPREVALAARALPIAVTPRGERATPTADRYIEPIVASEIRDLFQSAVDGELFDFDLLVITRPYAKLYYYLKEIYRLGRAPRLPQLHLFDLMQSRRDAVAAYNEGRFQDLIDAVARVTNQRPDDAELTRALALTQRSREAQRRLLELRWQNAVTGADALIAIGAGFFMEPRAYVAALDEFLASLAPQMQQGKPRWLVVTAEPLSHLNLHVALEEGGGLIVAEDDAWGSRAPSDDTPSDFSVSQPLLHRTCFEAATGHVWPPSIREAWFETQVVRREVDAVVFYVPPSDHQFGWDYPRLKAFAERAGKLTLLLRHDAQTQAGRLQIRAEAAALRAACAARTKSP